MPPKADRKPAQKKSFTQVKAPDEAEKQKKTKAEAKTRVIHMHHHHFHHGEKDYMAKHQGRAEIRKDPPRRYPGYVGRDPAAFH